MPAPRKPTAPKSPKKRAADKRYHHGNLRETLVSAALALIEEKGTRELTLREVARRAGVSHTAPYRHFDYKEAMLAAVAEQGFQLLQKGMTERAAGTDDAGERFHEACIAYIVFAMEHPAHYRLMFGPELAGRLEFPALSQASKAAFSVLEQVIAEGQRQGRIRGGVVRDFALATWSLVHGFAMLHVDGQIKNKGYKSVDVEGLMNHTVRVLTQGLRSA